MTWLSGCAMAAARDTPVSGVASRIPTTDRGKQRGKRRTKTMRKKRQGERTGRSSTDNDGREASFSRSRSHPHGQLHSSKGCCLFLTQIEQPSPLSPLDEMRSNTSTLTAIIRPEKGKSLLCCVPFLAVRFIVLLVYRPYRAALFRTFSEMDPPMNFNSCLIECCHLLKPYDGWSVVPDAFDSCSRRGHG